MKRTKEKRKLALSELNTEDNFEAWKKKEMTVAIDLDGTLVHDAKTLSDVSFTPLKGVSEFTTRLKNLGCTIVIHTARPHTQFKQIRDALYRNGIIFDSIVCAKVPAHLYIDNRGLRFNGNYEEVIEFIGKMVK